MRKDNTLAKTPEAAGHADFPPRSGGRNPASAQGSSGLLQIRNAGRPALQEAADFNWMFMAYQKAVYHAGMRNSPRLTW